MKDGFLTLEKSAIKLEKVLESAVILEKRLSSKRDLAAHQLAALTRKYAKRSMI